ncbi:hypothetical protein [Hydrogenophaga sp.]|uniref:hypothetical protein n=1 Tax=Hydrogenophaga sp. TaxID=1904254 RepID=UPI002639CDB5|nr:hypothetical protein [Hydrogenophaga sp.]MCW5653488.1 hypothetical protein [Hydrogenophaga sp.]
MSHPTPRRRRSTRRRRSQTLLDNALGAMVGGTGLWLLSIVMSVKEDLRMAARALLAPAWMALALGVGLLVLHVWRKRRTQVEAHMLLRQHSTFLEPMPKLRPRSRHGEDRSSRQRASHRVQAEGLMSRH